MIGGRAASAAGVRVDVRVLLAAAAVAGALVVYRGLFGFHPGAGVRNYVAGGEGMLFSPTGGSPFLVFGTTAWLLWSRQRRLLRSFEGRSSPIAAGTCLLAASAIALWAYYVAAPDLLILSLIAMLLGAGAWLGGRRAFGLLLLPALFLLFVTPLPPVLVNKIIFPLQMLTVELARWSLGAIGLSTRVHGDQIAFRDHVFQVVESCSGFRLIQTLMMSAVLYAQLFQCSRRRAFALFFAAPLIGIAVNAARVDSIILNPLSKFAAVHTAQGLVMLVIGVFAIAGLDGLLDRLVRHRPPPAAAPVRARAGKRAPGPFPTGRLAALTGFLAVLGAASLALPMWSPPALAWTVHDVPSDLGEWHSQPLDVDEPFLGSVDFSERLSRRFRRGDQEIDVLIGLDTRMARQKSLISEKTAYPGSGFDLVDAWSPAGLEGADARLGVMRGERGDRLVIHWYEDIASTPREALRQALALDRGPWRRPTPAVVVRVSTPVGSGADGRPAEARLREFLPLLRDALAQARARGEPRAAEASAWRG